jgi:hypothetical protein
MHMYERVHKAVTWCGLGYELALVGQQRVVLLAHRPGGASSC